jgi:hypothetical protein
MVPGFAADKGQTDNGYVARRAVDYNRKALGIVGGRVADQANTDVFSQSRRVGYFADRPYPGVMPH